MALIPDAALSWAWLRAGGPGGQHQNKSETAVQLRYSIPLGGLEPEAAERLRSLAGGRLASSDEIVIEARAHRSREMNRREALDKLQELIERALVEPLKRRRTRPTRASAEKRLEDKKKLSEKKAFRKGIPGIEPQD